MTKHPANWPTWYYYSKRKANALAFRNHKKSIQHPQVWHRQDTINYRFVPWQLLAHIPHHTLRSGESFSPTLKEWILGNPLNLWLSGWSLTCLHATLATRLESNPPSTKKYSTKWGENVWLRIGMRFTYICIYLCVNELNARKAAKVHLWFMQH